MKKLLYLLLLTPIIYLTSCSKSGDNTPTDLNIGDTHQGGIIFYLNGNGGGLIAAPSYQSTSAEWGCFQTFISGADGGGIGAGAQNTIDIEAGCTTAGTAADICANLTLGGYSDWFLPSKDELNKMYLNKAAIGGFAINCPNDYCYYWSSTEKYSDSAWAQDFNDGYEYSDDKRNGWYVRAVRAF